MTMTSCLDFKGKSEGYLPMVMKFTLDTMKQLPNTSLLEKDDIIQIHTCVLWSCIKNYKENKKTKFSTYLYVSLNNKKGRLLKTEWNHYDKLIKFREKIKQLTKNKNLMFAMAGRKRADINYDKVVELHQNGFPTRIIGERFGVTSRTVRNILYRKKIKLSRVKAIHITSEKMYFEYHFNKKTYRELAVKYGVARSTIFNRVKEYEINGKHKNDPR